MVGEFFEKFLMTEKTIGGLGSFKDLKQTELFIGGHETTRIAGLRRDP